MNDVLISVIVPVYNVELYVEECLESLRRQLLRDVEIICVDDCGTDESMKIVEECARRDDRIRIVRNERNLGVGQTKNRGLREARGKYILFVDSDDFLIDAALTELVDEIGKSDVDVIVFGANPFPDKASTTITQEYVDEYSDYYNSCFKYEGLHKVDDDNIEDIVEILPVSPIKMYKRQFLEDNKLTFLERHIAHDDDYWFLRWISKMPNILFIKKQFYQRRLRDNSIVMDRFVSSDAMKKDIRDFRIALWSARKQIQNKKLRNIILKRYIYSFKPILRLVRFLHRNLVGVARSSTS